MKTCSVCLEVKDLSEFPISNGKPLSKCRQCKRLYDNEYHLLTNETRLSRKSDNRKLIIERNRNYVWEYLSTHPCILCGESDIVVLEFDHIEPKLKFKEISMLITQCFAIDIIKKEIQKCNVLCANCHRRKTATQLGWAISRYNNGI